MASDVRTLVPNYGYAMLDKGIADIVVILNEKGYTTECSCEGHYWYCDGYANPKKRREYGQYRPIWLVFSKGCMPPYPPDIYPLDNDTEPWACEHARVYMDNQRNGMNELLVNFESYKRLRKNFSNGDVEAEHNKALVNVLEWAKGLPKLQ